MDAHLHVTDCDAIVSAVSDDLVLDLLPSFHASLDEHLRTCSEGFAAELDQLLLVLCEAGAETTECVRRSHDDRVADLLGSGRAFVEIDSRGRLGAVLADLCHGLREQLSVLGSDDGLDGCSEDFDAERLELVLHLDTDRQSRLTSEGDIDAVRSLVLDDLADKLGRDRQEVHLVCQTFRCLNGSDVGCDARAHGSEREATERKARNETDGKHDTTRMARRECIA